MNATTPADRPNSRSHSRSRTLRRGIALAAGIAAVAGAFVVIDTPGSSSATPPPANAAPANAATVAAAPGEGGKKPTVVLEHGAFADGSSWSGVISRLQHAGYPVVAPANPLRGVHSDAAALRSTVDHVKGPVVLAGHSYGGSVISQAAAHDPKVKALVYVAAFLPASGENALGLTGKFPGSTLAGALDPVPYTLPGGDKGTDLYVKPDKFHHQFAADVPANKAAVMAATQRPVTQAALKEKATQAAWKSIPAWDLITTEDRNIPPAAQRFMAKRAHAHTTKIAASHAVAVSHPGAVTSVIEQAAHATVK